MLGIDNIDNNTLLEASNIDDEITPKNINIREKGIKIMESICYVDELKYMMNFTIDFKNKKIDITCNCKQAAKSFNFIDNNNKIVREIKFNDLFYYISQYVYKGYNKFCSLFRLIKNFIHFARRILLNYIQILKINNKLSLCFTKYSKGNTSCIYANGRPEFTFMNETCTFTSTKYTEKNEFNIHNVTYDSYIYFLFTIDNSSVRNKISPKTKKNLIDFDFNQDFDYWNFFSDLFIKIEKILKSRDEEVKNFTEYVKKYKWNTYQINITKNASEIEFIILWPKCQKDIKSEGKNEENNIKKENNKKEEDNNNIDKKKFEWQIDFYTINKLQLNNCAFFVHKNIVLDNKDFENIIGSDYLDIYKIINSIDLKFIYFFIINSVGRKNIPLVELNQRNYLSSILLIKIKPKSFYRYKFVFTHIKRFFVCSADFFAYNRNTIFYRIMIMETISNRTYSKIYCTFLQLKKEVEFDDIEEKIKEKYSIFVDLYQNKKKLKEFLIYESCLLLTKNSDLILVENFSFLTAKIKEFLFNK